MTNKILKRWFLGPHNPGPHYPITRAGEKLIYLPIVLHISLIVYGFLQIQDCIITYKIMRYFKRKLIKLIYESGMQKNNSINYFTHRIRGKRISVQKQIQSKVAKPICETDICTGKWIRLNSKFFPWKFLEQTTASRCEGFPTSQGLNPFPSSGCCWWFGRTVKMGTK